MRLLAGCWPATGQRNGATAKGPGRAAKNQLRTVGERIQGDFNGDGRIETAVVLLVKQGQGNPVEDGRPDEYAVRFSDKAIKNLSIGCCAGRIVNEGDLNNDGADELSVFQAPMNGCVYTMATHRLRSGKWQQLVPPFLIPTACKALSNDELQQRIVKEDGVVYFYDTDANAGRHRLIKKRVLVEKR